MGALCEAQGIDALPNRAGIRNARGPLAAVPDSNFDGEQSIKIVVTGDNGVGKTSLITKYMHDFMLERKDYLPTGGVDIWKGTN